MMRRILAVLVLLAPQAAPAASLTGEEASGSLLSADSPLKIPEKPQVEGGAGAGIDDLGAASDEDGADAPIDLGFGAGGSQDGGFGADAPSFDANEVSEIGAGDDLYFMLNKAGANDPALLRRLRGCVFDCADAATRERVKEIWRAPEKKKRHGRW